MNLATLEEQLAALPDALQQRLAQRGFRTERLLAWAASLEHGSDARNRLRGTVAPPPEGLVNTPPTTPAARARLTALGEAALERGEVAICVLAGGMATRMGGLVKALVDVLPGRSFLDLRLAERDQLERRYGHAPPLWLMTSEPTDGPIRDALGERCDGRSVATFEQLVALRLTAAGELFRDGQGAPSVYATGHGDLPEALLRANVLDSFREGGGKYVWISNIDNLGACVDPLLLGCHIEAAGPLTVELVDKHEGDRGGGPVLHDGRGIIAEEFRLPHSFDPSSVPVFNTNTFVVATEAIAALDMEWTYVQVSKTVGAAQAVQFERLLGELTVGLDTHFLRVERDGEDSRFLPVKTHADLQQLRPAIERLAAKRDLLAAR